jgi:glycosyltransferase involved in cell wall biosynthesis
VNISAFLPVFNEEHRISFALNSLIWCDEVIVIDKGSIDRTREICSKFKNVSFYTISNSSDMNLEFEFFLKICTSDWFIIFTASDIIHPNLAYEIRKTINNTDASILSIPFKRIVLGVDSKRSPWHTDYNPIVFRKSDVYINSNEVHGALKSNGVTIILRQCNNFPMYHLTHESVEKLMQRHLRYWEGEAKIKNLKQSIKEILISLFNILFKKKTYLLGYKGIALMFAFLSYKMMSFVYKWDYNNDTESYYNDIREKIQLEWDKTI